jgi:hypothetical protein
VEAKTRLRSLIEYLLELNKIPHTRFYISLENKGRPVSDDSMISQVLKHTKPQNGVIKLYVYEQSEEDSL